MIVLVGLPRSGKSTAARRLGHPIVNPDSIRLALHGQRFQVLAEPMVWAIAHICVRQLFLAGHATVILDATNTTRKSRDVWRYPGMDVQFWVIETPVGECRRRAEAMGDEYILPIIERMALQFEPLGEDEPRFTIPNPYHDEHVDEKGFPIDGYPMQMA